MPNRAKSIDALKHTEVFDTVIVGGGINGAVSAACLSQAGYSVLLIDKQDFAGLTSSQSSNLAWGGIKYLETHEYKLVADLCRSRNELMEAFPSTVKEIRFVTTLAKGFRHKPWFIYLGTLVYWAMGRFFTKRPYYLSTKELSRRVSFIDTNKAAGGAEYSDCYLYDNDARFVFNFIKRAQKAGAVCVNYVEATSASYERVGDDRSVDATDASLWHMQLQDSRTAQTFSIKARSLVNAGGPLADQFNKRINQQTDHKHVFSKGIHLIVDRISKNDDEHQKVLTFFANDGRMFFIIPMGNKTCLGTTDTRVENPHTQVSDEDRQFVLDNVNRMLNLARPLTVDDIISERCGVRPLAVERQARVGNDDHDWLNISRKHAIDTVQAKRLITIFGGKLTDCINVGEEIRRHITQWLPKASSDKKITEQPTKPKWYGEPAASVRARFFRECRAMKIDLLTSQKAVESISTRLWRRYAEDAFLLLERIAEDPKELTPVLQCANYLLCEVHYAAEHESIVELSDFLRRRGKLSLVVRHDTLINDPGFSNLVNILFAHTSYDPKKIIQRYVESCSKDQSITLDL